MSNQPQKIRLPEEAIVEFKTVEQSDWSSGVSLEELVDWINWVSDRFRPEGIPDSSRSAADFTKRSFRHYQTLGCIDKPERVGRNAVYRFRQYLQALVIRKLLWERVSSAQIVSLMQGRSNEELKQLLFEGIEIVPFGDASAEEKKPVNAVPQRWTRVTLAPGVEIHLDEARPPLEKKEIEAAVVRLKALLRNGKS